MIFFCKFFCHFVNHLVPQTKALWGVFSISFLVLSLIDFKPLKVPIHVGHRPNLVSSFYGFHGVVLLQGISPLEKNHTLIDVHFTWDIIFPWWNFVISHHYIYSKNPYNSGFVKMLTRRCLCYIQIALINNGFNNTWIEGL